MSSSNQRLVQTYLDRHGIGKLFEVNLIFHFLILTRQTLVNVLKIPIKH